MKIPNKIKVGGHTITVEFADTKTIDDSGAYNNFHNNIRILKEKGAPEDNIAEILLHEIIEAIKCKNNLELDHTVLTVLSESLFQVMRDNKLNFSNSNQT